MNRRFNSGPAGIAVFDVNYRGSTGFGRRYRRLLDGNWGVADMEDCVAGARMLVEQGLVDGERMAISGGSAGGYTTLCALTYSDLFKAGASHYGIGDLEALARDTHKFESAISKGSWGDGPKTVKPILPGRRYTIRIGFPAQSFSSKVRRTR